MVKLKQLVGRVYDDNECVGFSYWLGDADGNRVQLVQFFKASGVWVVQAVLPSGLAWRGKVDEVTYGVLENVAANGLLKLQSFLEDAVSYGQQACHYIALSLRGM
jgi:hypothetical protein|nr:MAG TPA: hypothetical protein [Caudoviricetes sp.]